MSTFTNIQHAKLILAVIVIKHFLKKGKYAKVFWYRTLLKKIGMIENEKEIVYCSTILFIVTF
jgi:hypothetical protein